MQKNNILSASKEITDGSTAYHAEPETKQAFFRLTLPQGSRPATNRGLLYFFPSVATTQKLISTQRLCTKIDAVKVKKSTD